MTKQAQACVMYLFRHGATTSNLANPPRLQGRGINLGLSPEGLRQASAARRLLTGFSIRAVYASPLLRSRETAEAIALPHGLKISTADDLIEVDVGHWEGKCWQDIALEEPDAYRRFQTDCGTHGYGGGENLQQVQNRVVPCLARIANAHAGEEIVVVGHNVVNRAFLAHVLQMPLPNARTLVQDNCGVNVIHISAGETRLVTMNATFHLAGAE